MEEARNRLVEYNRSVPAGDEQLVDGQARLMSKPHTLRLISTKDGSPLRNKVKVSRNSPCPCNSGKKFKNCHQKGM